MTDANDWNRQIIEEFRANEGQVGGQFAGAPSSSSPPPGPGAGSRGRPR